VGAILTEKAPRRIKPEQSNSARPPSTASITIGRLFQFEGASRRVENPIDPSSSVDAKSQQKKDMHSPAPAPLPSIDADLQRLEGSAPTEWSESTVGLKQ